MAIQKDILTILRVPGPILTHVDPHFYSAHNGVGNGVFLDGHVESMHGARLLEVLKTENIFYGNVTIQYFDLTGVEHSKWFGKL